MFDLPSYTRSLRLDVRELRIDNSRLKRSVNQQRDKSKKLNEEVGKLRQENRKLRKENVILKQEIEKLTKTNNRYQIALFDHGNFKHPENAEKKPKGGQIGHPDTNREVREDYSSYEKKRLFLTHCASCGRKLKRVSSTQKKILLDIVINPSVLKYILESERQWCSGCRKEVNSRDIRSLPFSEYGLNTFMAILILRFKVHASFTTISKLLTTFFGLTIIPSSVSRILSQAKQYLEGKYDSLLREVRNGGVMYNDETGWQVRGKGAWMWIAASKNTTIYFAGESRGGGIAKGIYGKSKAYSMHDGYGGYSIIPPEKQMFCWSHILRFAFEETVNSPPGSDAVKLRDELVGIFQLKKNNPGWSKDKLEKELTEGVGNVLETNSKEVSFQNIKKRLLVQKDGLIRALLVTPDGTNNLAERELRPIVIGRKISYGSDTYTGMKTSAILSSIVRTAERRTNEAKLLPTLQKWLTQGVKKNYPNYAYLW